jgi:glycine oxidase
MRDSNRATYVPNQHRGVQCLSLDRYANRTVRTFMKALIIGGGIIGASVAWRLAQYGAQVTVLERARLGHEASWAAAGLIGPQVEAQEPGVFFDLCMAGKRAFDSIVDRLTAESGIDPEYDSHGALYVAFDEAGAARLQSRARWQQGVGAQVDELTPAEALKLAPALSSEVICALHMPTNRRTENRKLTMAYVRAAEKAGAAFREGARVAEVVTHAGRAAGVRFDDGATESADVVVNAAGSWAGEIRGLEADHVRFYPVRGQIICFEAPAGLLGPSLFSPDGILVPRRDGRLIAGSIFEDAGFNKSVTLSGIATITSAVAAMVPGLRGVAFREAWAGLRPASDDQMPVLGESPSVPGVFYAAGHFRSGILLSALTGEVIADLVTGRKPSIDLTPFTPARFRNGDIKRIPLDMKHI